MDTETEVSFFWGGGGGEGVTEIRPFGDMSKLGTQPLVNANPTCDHRYSFYAEQKHTNQLGLTGRLQLEMNKIEEF